MKDHPRLAQWHQQLRQRPSFSLTPADRLALKSCEAISMEASHAAPYWFAAFKHFLAESLSPSAEFEQVEIAFQRCDATFLDFISKMGEAAILSGRGQSFFTLMQKAADQINLVALRFLAAWAALNNQDLQGCIAECEKVDMPFAAIYTIHGQALIELSRPQEATDILQIAVRLAPNDLMAWFQLAKAYHVLEQHEKTWQALRESIRLAPQSEEVALFMAIVALNTNSLTYAQIAWEKLFPHLSRIPNNAALISWLFHLALRLEQREHFIAILAGASWNKIDSSSSLIKELPSILRGLNHRGWMKEGASLLEKLTPNS